MNRLYTLEGYKNKNKTVGNPLLASLFKMPKINLPAFKLPTFTPPPVPKFTPPPVPKISIPKLQAPKISIPKFQAPRISTPSLPKISPPKFPSMKSPKNPFSSKQKPDMSSSYQDFFNEIESQKEANFQPEPNYPQLENEFTQNDMEAETNLAPVYGYDYNDVMVGALKLSKIKIKAPKIGTKLSLGRKKPTVIQKLSLKSGSKKIVKITPQELKKGLAVTGAVAGAIATGGASAPLIAPLVAGAATITGVTASSIIAGAGTVATASALGSTLMANGGTDIGSLLNTAGALLNNQTIKDNVPLANSANQAINTGLNYYNTGAGIAEGLGLTPPNLGTTAEEMFSLLGNKDSNTLDRALQITQDENSPQPLNPFKNPLTDPTSPLYVPPVVGKPQGQKGTTQIITTDKNKTQTEQPNSNIALIIGIGVLGYLFMNKKGKQ